MDYPDTTHALACLQRVGEACDCWVKDRPIIDIEELAGDLDIDIAIGGAEPAGEMPCDLSPRAKILQRGLNITTGDRNRTYGAPEPNLTLQYELWVLYKAMAGDKHSMAHDAAMQHCFAKIARIASGPPLHEDNYVDLSVYSAIAYECDVRVLGAAPWTA